MKKVTMEEIGEELTEQEQMDIENAGRMPWIEDPDCPAMTLEQLSQFKKMNRDARAKKTVSLRLSPETLGKAKQYGKGYTSFLSRLLDAAIQDEELVRKCI